MANVKTPSTFSPFDTRPRPRVEARRDIVDPVDSSRVATISARKLDEFLQASVADETEKISAKYAKTPYLEGGVSFMPSRIHCGYAAFIATATNYGAENAVNWNADAWLHLLYTSPEFVTAVREFVEEVQELESPKS